MSVNSSSNSSLNPSLGNCLTSRTSIFISTALAISFTILLLPLFILVLYVGYQRWRKQRSVATAATTSHSDIFTFNMVVLEMVSVLGSCLFSYGTYTNQTSITVGMYMFTITTPGVTLFHLLTCVEHYLAVVHPVTYLSLRQAGGVKIRNISIGCIWLLCFGWLGLYRVFGQYFSSITTSCLFVFSLIVVSFCSLSILCILIRPGPGEVDGKRERVDQSKQRAFNTIMVIMGALLLRFLSSLVSTLIYFSVTLSSSDVCLVKLSAVWFALPSSLVLPLLFLHRAGKLPCCKQNTEST